MMVCGPGEEGTFTIRSSWLVSALTEIGERAAPQGAGREAAGLRQPAAAVRPGDRTAHRLAPWDFPRPSRTWRSFNACVHLIREDERIAAG